MRNIKIWFVAICAILIANASSIKSAHALLITQSYIFIGPNEGTGMLRAKNMTNEPRAFRVGWDELKMLPDGQRQKLDSVEEAAQIPGLMPASPYLYVAPRRMMMQPDQLQNVRIMLRRTQNLQPGEYRSYITFFPEEMPETITSETDSQTPKPNASSGRLSMRAGMRIPVYFLHGETTLSVNLRDLSWGVDERGNSVLNFTMDRGGTRSAIGDIDVNCEMADGNVQVLQTFPFRIFTEINVRTSFFLLSKNDFAACARSYLSFTPHKQDPLYTGVPIEVEPITF